MIVERYFVATAEITKGPDIAEPIVFVVAPGLGLKREDRTVEQILEAANSGGHEISYVNSYAPGWGRIVDNITEAILRDLRKTHNFKSSWDVDVDVKSLIRVVRP